LVFRTEFFRKLFFKVSADEVVIGLKPLIKSSEFVHLLDRERTHQLLIEAKVLELICVFILEGVDVVFDGLKERFILQRGNKVLLTAATNLHGELVNCLWLE
jgi:hypothetical protein